jgi:hypothetical protein
MLERSDGKTTFSANTNLPDEMICDSERARMPDPDPVDPRFLGAPPGTPIPRLYVNAIGIRGGPFDVTLDLGFGPPAASPDQPPEAPEWLARVSMSWEHAAALRRFLEVAIKQFEEQVGPVPNVEKIRVEGQP